MLYRIDKYLLSQFFTVLSMSLLGFLAVFLVVDLIENLDRFVDNSVPAVVTITYYLIQSHGLSALHFQCLC